MVNSARLIQALGLSIGMVIFASGARAQTPNDTLDYAVAHVGVGAGINFYQPRSSEADSSQGFVFAYRWHAFHSGWGPTFGLDWHTTDFHQVVGPSDVPLGSIRMRALYGGFGYTKRLGRFTASGNVFGGYAFNSLTVDSGFGPALAARTGVSLVNVSVNDSGVVKPEVAVWYDVFRHVGVGVSAGYLYTRPEEALTTGNNVLQVRQLNADTWELAVGVTVGVWKKKQQQ
jgi:hypothetical protein